MTQGASGAGRAWRVKGAEAHTDPLPGHQQVALAPEDRKKKMPAANLSGCHCGCRWWGRDLPSSPWAAEPHVPESRIVQSEVWGGMRSGAHTCPGSDPGRRCRLVPALPLPLLSVSFSRLGDSSRSSVRATPTPSLSGPRKDRLCSDLRPYPTPSLVVMATAQRARGWGEWLSGHSWPCARGAPVPRGQPTASTADSAPTRPRGGRTSPNRAPLAPDSRFLARGAPAPTPHSAAPCGPSLFVSRPQLFLGHPAVPCRPLRTHVAEGRGRVAAVSS